MSLKQSDCIYYYCNQAGGGDYFKGVPHQRGYGLFGDIFRKISPFLLDAAKYFGKQLLHTGTKVAEDITSGSSIKESAKRRIAETGRKIKDDVMRKVQLGSGIKRKRSPRKCHLPKKKIKLKHNKIEPKDVFSI